MFSEMKEVNYTGQVAFRALLPMSNVPPGVAKIPYAMFVGLNSGAAPLPIATPNHDERDWHGPRAKLAGGRMGDSRDD